MRKILLLITTTTLLAISPQKAALQYKVTVKNFSSKKIFPEFYFRIQEDQFVTKHEKQCKAGVCSVKSLKGIYPYDTGIFLIQTRHLIHKKAVQNSGKNLEAYLKPEKLIESKHPLILNAAQRYQKRTPKEMVKRIAAYAKSKVKLSPFIERDLGALFALKEGRGDCTEIASLITAMLRANKIPARVIGGYYLKEKPLRYHNWVEALIENQWVLIDPINKNIDQYYDRYLPVEIYHPGQKHRFWHNLDRKQVKVKINFIK